MCGILCADARSTCGCGLPAPVAVTVAVAVEVGASNAMNGWESLIINGITGSSAEVSLIAGCSGVGWPWAYVLPLPELPELPELEADLGRGHADPGQQQTLFEPGGLETLAQEAERLTAEFGGFGHAAPRDDLRQHSQCQAQK